MGKNVVEVILRAKDLTGSALSKFRRNFRAMRRVVMDVTKAVVATTAAVGALVLGLTKLGERGDRVNAVKRAFAKITGDETKALRELRQAAQGTINDYELMSLANQALTLGAAKTTSQFAEMVEVSRQLGRAQGIDAKSALESLTIGLARQSPRILDNIGIQIQLGDTTTFAARAMEQARAKAEQYTAEVGSGVSATARFSAAIANLRDRFAELVAESPLIASLFDTMTDLVDDLATIIAKDPDTIVEAFSALGSLAGNAFGVAFMESAAAVLNAFDRMFLPKFLEDKLATPFGIFGGAAEGQADQFRGNVGAWREVLASLARRPSRSDVAGAGGGPGTMNLGGGDPLSLDPVAFRSMPSGFSPEALEYHRRRKERKQRVRLGPAVMAPGGFGLAPGMISPGAPPGTDEQIDADTIREGADAMGEAGQVVVASMFGMAQAAMRGSDQVAQSVVSMITQIAQSLPGVGGIFGTIIGGVGGLIGAALSRGKNRDPVPVRVDDITDAAARKWQNNGQPIRITTITEVGGVETERIERELISRQNRDEVVRYRGGSAVGT